MLIAAMILGIIGGTAYFIGGGAGSIALNSGDAPWWVIALIPIGAAGVMGGALVRLNPSFAGVVMLLAAAAAISVGFASYEEVFDVLVPVGARNYLLMSPEYLPQHPFAGSAFFLPVPLLSLVIGGALALSSGKKPASD